LTAAWSVTVTVTVTVTSVARVIYLLYSQDMISSSLLYG
jgi:hypothetical protein